MPNSIHHITLSDLIIDFSGDGQLETLAVTKGTGGTDPLIFLWRAGVGARAVQILRDTSSDLEVSKEIPLVAYPIDAVLSSIRANARNFTKDILPQIIRILEENRAEK